MRATAVGTIPESFRYVALDVPTADGFLTRLWLVDLTGGRGPVVVADWEAPASPAGGYSASADGRTVLVAATGSRSRVALYLLRPELGTTSVLFEEPGWIALSPALSADGAVFAFTRYPDGGGSDDGLYAGPIAGGEPRRIVAPDPQAIAPPLALGWSFDAAWLAYLRTRGSSDVVLAHRSGGSGAEIGPGDRVSWRRDPPQLLVAANGSGADPSRIYTYELATAAKVEVARVERAFFSFVQWHPHFDRFIYVESTDRGREASGGIWIRNADGSAPTRFDLGSGAYAPEWSRDGTLVTALTGGDDSIVRLIELFTGRQVAVLCRRGGTPPADCV